MPVEQWLEDAQVSASKSGPESLAALIGIFYEQGRAGKDRLVSLLRDKPDSLVYPALGLALRENENANQRNAAMEIYCALGGRSIPPLLALLRDGDEEVRTFACVMLGNMEARQAVPGLVQSLADPDLNVKHAAAESLGKIGDPRAVDPLIKALASDMWLQFPAAAALGDIGDARAVPPLLALLDTPGANVPAIQALGKIGDAAAVDPLCTFLEDDEPSLREWALEAVAKLLSKNPHFRPGAVLSMKAQDILIGTLKSDSLKARRNAAIALGRFGVSRAVPVITGLLSDRETREEALDALVKIGGEHALPGLDACASDSDPLVRRAAVQTLAGLGTERSLKIIPPLLSDPDPDVRAEAALALSRSDSAEARGALERMLADISGAAREAEKKLLEAYAAITGKAGSPLAFVPADVIPLRDYVSEKFGLFFDDERLSVLYHRLSPLAAAGGFHSLSAFHRHLTDGPGSTEMLNKMASQLSNNETYFFRETEQLQAFITSVLPEMLRRKPGAGRGKLRILSAGCSSGEEVYTVAMLLEEAGIRSQGCDVEILGLDIDQGVLNAARQARYPARSFRRDENRLVQKYFRCADSQCQVNERIRDMAAFTHGNVLECAALGSFDVIFCRNVLIYFSDSSIERAAKNFHRMLPPGGYLLLGHSESLCRVEADFDPVRLEGAVVYRKR